MLTTFIIVLIVNVVFMIGLHVSISQSHTQNREDIQTMHLKLLEIGSMVGRIHKTAIRMDNGANRPAQVPTIGDFSKNRFD